MVLGHPRQRGRPAADFRGKPKLRGCPVARRRNWLLYLRQGTPFPSCSAPFYTGGTRGIGRAIAELLAEEGCNVALCARHEAAVDETVMALTGKGVKSWGGVADAKALRAWVAEAAAALGGLGIFVANVSALAQSMDEDSWRRSQEIDSWAPSPGSRRPSLSSSNRWPARSSSARPAPSRSPVRRAPMPRQGGNGSGGPGLTGAGAAPYKRGTATEGVARGDGYSSAAARRARAARSRARWAYARGRLVGSGPRRDHCGRRPPRRRGDCRALFEPAAARPRVGRDPRREAGSADCVPRRCARTRFR